MSKSKNLPLKILKVVLAVAVIAVTAALIGVWQIGAWNLLFPNRSHDTTAPTIPDELKTPAVLVFSKTNGFRHVEGIEGGAKILESIAGSHHWGVFHTENGAVFNKQDLQRFDVVVFLNATGDMLSRAQEKAFQSWMLAGGAWLGIHAAGDSSHLEWQWYRDNLIGATFTAHIMGPQFQTASVVLENQQHPALLDLPDTWQHEEEWYSWEKSPRLEGFTILATLDESSYVPEADFMGTKTDLRMGDHPVVWANCVGQGKSVYTAMGHRADAFEQPQNRRLLDNALSWLIDTRGQPCQQ